MKYMYLLHFSVVLVCSTVQFCLGRWTDASDDQRGESLDHGYGVSGLCEEAGKVLKEARGPHQSSSQYRKTRNDVELSCGPLELSSSSSWKCIESIVLGKRQQLNFLRDLCLDRRQYHRLLVGDTDLVHLVVASNLAQLPGLRTLVQSAYKSIKTPSKLHFHIVWQIDNYAEPRGPRNGPLDLESLHTFVREVGGQPLRLHYFRKRRGGDVHQ